MGLSRCACLVQRMTGRRPCQTFVLTGASDNALIRGVGSGRSLRLPSGPGWAESVNSLHLRWYPVKDMKAVIHGSGSTPPLRHPGTKVSNAQIAGFAKYGPFPDSGLSCSEPQMAGESPL